MLKAYSKFLDGLEKAFLIILGILLMAMSGIMVYQVVLRYVFHRPNVWSEELVRMMFAWVCFVGGPICIRRNSHVKVDFLLVKLPESFRYLWQAIIVLFCIAFCIIIVPVSIPMIKQVVHHRSLGANIPMWIPYLSVPFGGVFMTVFGIELFIKNLEKHLAVCRAKAKEGGV